MQSGLFWRRGLDDPNQLEIFQQISFYAHPVSGTKQPERSGIQNERNPLGPTGKSSLRRGAGITKRVRPAGAA
jgi:hypothetical protein